MKETVQLQDICVVMLSPAAGTNVALNRLKNRLFTAFFFFSFYYLFIKRADRIAKWKTRLGGLSAPRKMVENHDHDFVQGRFAACSSCHD